MGEAAARRALAVRGAGPWLDVDKWIWCVGGGEIAQLSVAGARWWTVAVRVEAGDSLDHAPLLAWIDALSTTGKPHSYASLLTELCRHPSAQDAVA